MTKPGKYRKASSWFFYLLVAAAFHAIIGGWAHAQQISFVSAKQFSTGGGIPRSVAVGDFNRDGNRDVAVVSESSSNVSILLGNGDGTFGTAVNFPVGSSANFAVVVSYFNGDSIQDLAVAGSENASSTSGSVSVLLGNGNGTFRPAMSFPAANISTHSLDFGDFNNDGFRDLVVPGALFLGNGDGTFKTRSLFATQAYSSVAGYFNNDGILDIAEIIPDDSPVFLDWRIVVHLGNGDGTFQSPYYVFVGGPSLHPHSIAVGYFNRDAIADLAVAQHALDDNSDFGTPTMSILLGNGDGTFRRGATVGLGLLGPLVVDDFNGDDIADVAQFAGDRIFVALGKGDGSFRTLYIGAAVGYGSSFESGSPIAVGDFNSDGRKDVVVTSRDVFEVLGVSVLLGWGDGTFQGTWNYYLGLGANGPPPGAPSPTVSFGEFNGDGIQDLAVLIAAGRLARIAVLLGNGDGSFRWAFEFETGDIIFPDQDVTLAVGEFNGDRIQDLVLAANGRVAVFLGNGNGLFQPPLRTERTGIASIAVGYFNSDWFMDVAGIGQFGIGVLLSNGDGTFRAPMYFDSGAEGGLPRAVIAGDFNADGSQDLVTTNPDAGSISVLLGNGDGTFRTPLISNVGGRPGLNIYYHVHRTVAVADFNNDRLPDLVMVNGPVLLGNGDGTFHLAPGNSPGLGAPGFGVLSLAVGDFDRDGIEDLVVTRFDTDYDFYPILSFRHTHVFRGKGDGSFEAGVIFNTTDASSIAVGDFSGDGRPDIAVAGDVVTGVTLRSRVTLSVLINNTP